MDDYGAVRDGADAENGNLWLIDDRCAQEAAEDSRIRDGEGPVLDISRCQLFLARPAQPARRQLAPSLESFSRPHF